MASATQTRPENAPERIVVSGQGAIFVTPNGDPIVPVELSREVSAAAAKFGLSMKVEWLSSAYGQSGYVVKQQWPQGDPKWARVQCGECPPENAFDIVFRFPREMRTGDMIGLIRDKFGFVRDPRAEAERMMQEAAKLMAQANEQATDDLVEKGTQRILDESTHTRLVRAGLETAHPMVPGADFSNSHSDREPKRLLSVVK